MAPKHKGSDAGNSDTPRKSCKVLPCSEEVKVQDTERPHSHNFHNMVTYFIRVVVNLQLYLIDKLSFIIGMWGKLIVVSLSRNAQLN